MIKCWGVTLLTTGWVQLLDKCNVSYLRFFKSSIWQGRSSNKMLSLFQTDTFLSYWVGTYIRSGGSSLKNQCHLVSVQARAMKVKLELGLSFGSSGKIVPSLDESLYFLPFNFMDSSQKGEAGLSLAQTHH